MSAQQPQYQLNPKNKDNHAKGGVSVAKKVRQLGESFGGERLEPLCVSGPSGSPSVLIRVSGPGPIERTPSGKILPETHPMHPKNLAHNKSQNGRANNQPMNNLPMQPQKQVEFEDPPEPVGEPLVPRAPAHIRADDADVEKIATAIRGKPANLPKSSETPTVLTETGTPDPTLSEADGRNQNPIEMLDIDRGGDRPPVSTQSIAKSSHGHQGQQKNSGRK